MKLRTVNSFIALWVSAQWEAMARTGKGYRRYKLGHTGNGDDRRPDKLNGESSLLRRYRNHYT